MDNFSAQMLIENQIQKGINNQTLLIVASAANA
jgi:hypothetical protein